MASSDAAVATPSEQVASIDTLSKSEERWKALHSFLKNAGYRLRYRYKPDWKPSWLESQSNSPEDHEDFLRPADPKITHAINLTTGLYVVLKLVDTSTDSRELEMMEFLLSEQRDKDPRNHCARVIEILTHPTEPNVRIVILPLLRKYDDPPFETIGEVVDFLGQFLEGIEFLHSNGVAHTDISIDNFMLDGNDMYPHGFHPLDQSRNATYTGPAEQQFTRTEKPPAYFFVDFGTLLLSGDGDTGRKATVPEPHEDAKEATGNPFEVDVYRLGNMIKKDIIEGDPNLACSGYHGFDFLTPLVEAMTHPTAKERPTITAALEQFHTLVQNVGGSHLRARCRRKALSKGDREPIHVGAVHAMRHTYRRMVYMYKGFPAVPQRNPPRDKEPVVVEQAGGAVLTPGKV